MTSPRVFEFLFVMTFTLMSTTCVSSYDDIDNVMASDIGRDSFTLNWQWVIDADDEYVPWGCRIITRLNNNQQVVHEVEIEGDNTSYTVSENVTHWELYISCITPILTDGNVKIDGEESTCTDKIQTLYDPWTERAELAVICTGVLIFMAVVAQIINFKWPRNQKRTFTLPDDEDDEDDDKNDDDEGDGKTESLRDLDNLGFEQDEDATSSVNDWNTAAAMAVVETKGGKTRGGIKQWVKHADVQHKQMRLPDNPKDSHDLNHNNSQAQTGGQPGSSFPVYDRFKGNVVGSVVEGAPVAEVDTYHLPYQPVRPNEEPLHPAYQNPEPHQPVGENSELDEPAYQNQQPYHLAYENQEPHRPTYLNQESRQPTYHDQEPNQSIYQNQQFPDDYGQGMQDDAPRDHDYRNYGYEDDLDNPYGYDQQAQQYPTGCVIEDQYDTRIPSVEDDYSRYM